MFYNFAALFYDLASCCVYLCTVQQEMILLAPCDKPLI